MRGQVLIALLSRHLTRVSLQGLLNDDTLWKLSDSEADVLDISRSPDLTHEGILRGLQVRHGHNL